MARFERGGGGGRDRRDSKPRFSRDGGQGKSSFGGRSGGRSSGRSGGGRFSDRRDRGSRHGSRNRRDFEMTSVTCASCGEQCEVPFKPTSNKPVYCSGCFKKDKGGSNGGGCNCGVTTQDLDVINEKLNKIMKALHIEKKEKKPKKSKKKKDTVEDEDDSIENVVDNVEDSE
jgi:CxxC-x17-CxxC domain-containing protein